MTLQVRLHRCMTRASMRVSDLARWLDRPRTTVETWLRGREPARYYRDLVEEKLTKLELAIKNGFTIPVGTSWPARVKLILEKRDGAKRNDRVSKGRAA